jgi:DNA primase large subunit
MVDELSRKHFPICMRNLHENLRRDHHLKHYGRLQYGLFLKVTLSLPCAVSMPAETKGKCRSWACRSKRLSPFGGNHSVRLQTTSSTRSTSTTFVTLSVWREDERTIRPRGKTISPLLCEAHSKSTCSCQQILTSDSPGANDSHGCPYRHFSPENLQTALLSSYSSQGLTTADLPEIMQAVKGGHYHVACTRVFEITHASRVKKGEGVGGGESVTHPNQYAAKSIELEKADIEGQQMDLEP